MDEQIFISYSAKDKSIAEAICEMFEGSGWRCWIAPRDILPSGDWSEAIIDAINQSRLMVLVYSHSASRSIQIKREVERAASKGVTIIPFRVEDVPVPKSLEYYLSTAYWLDAVSPDLQQHFEYLSEMVGQLMGTPKTNGAAGRPGQCAQCGTAMQPGVKQCDECGHVRKLLSVDKETSSASSKPWKARRWRLFRLRSRAAKISVIILCLAILASGLYFSIDRRGAEVISVDKHLNRVEEYLKEREYDRAIEECTRAIEKYPSNPLLYRARGNTYYARNRNRKITSDLSQAIADFTTAINLDPRDDHSLYMRAQSYAFQNAFDRAIDDLNAAIEINDHASELYSLRGNMVFQLKKYDQAINDYVRAIELEPDKAIYYAWVAGALVKRGDYDLAVDYLTAAIDRDPTNPYLYRERSKVYLKLNKKDEADKDEEHAASLPQRQQ